ncbi:MAG: SDR family oxidoreductase [Pseudomonadota bacterium]
MARILVTGASGYIGSVLVDQLLKSGHQVTGLDWMVFGDFPLKPFRDDPNFELMQQDLRELPARALRNIDVVCDLAALPNEACCELDSALAREINLTARKRLVRVAKAMGVKRYVCMTSCCHYDRDDGEAADEQTPLATPSRYTGYHDEVEQALLSSAAEGFSVTVLRAASTYGLSRRMRFDLMANAVILHAFKTRRLAVRGDGEASLPFIHVRDLCRAVEAVIAAPVYKVGGEIFNAASENKSVNEVVAAACAVLPKPVSVSRTEAEPGRPVQPVVFQKLLERTDFSPRITLEQGMLELYIALKGGRTEPSPVTHTEKHYASLIGKSAGKAAAERRVQ